MNTIVDAETASPRDYASKSKTTQRHPATSLHDHATTPRTMTGWHSRFLPNPSRFKGHGHFLSLRARITPAYPMPMHIDSAPNPDEPDSFLAGIMASAADRDPKNLSRVLPAYQVKGHPLRHEHHRGRQHTRANTDQLHMEVRLQRSYFNTLGKLVTFDTFIRHPMFDTEEAWTAACEPVRPTGADYISCPAHVEHQVRRSLKSLVMLRGMCDMQHIPQGTYKAWFPTDRRLPATVHRRDTNELLLSAGDNSYASWRLLMDSEHSQAFVGVAGHPAANKLELCLSTLRDQGNMVGVQIPEFVEGDPLSYDQPEVLMWFHVPQDLFYQYRSTHPCIGVGSPYLMGQW